MESNKIRMYGTNWCGDCRRAKQFFHDYGIEFDWIDIDRDKDAEQLVRQINHGNRSVPTIVFPDGSVLVEPRYLDLAKKMNLEI